MPCTLAVLMIQRLLWHLPDGICAAQEYALRDDRHGFIILILFRLMNSQGSDVSALSRDAGVMDHDVQPAKIFYTPVQ